MNARTLAHTEIGTDENEVISTISVAASAITTTAVIAIGVMQSLLIFFCLSGKIQYIIALIHKRPKKSTN